MGTRPRLLPPCVLAVLVLVLPGHAAAAVEPKVVGGHTTSISDYPWQVAVVDSLSVSTGNAYQRQYCGGSLITSRIVITAAHCVRNGPKTVDPGDVDVVAGRTTLSNTGEGVEIPVQDVSYRSTYNPSTSANDVGYLVLASPSSQSPIKIAGADETGLWDPGSPVDVSGWGSTSEVGSTVDALRAATVEMISDSVCGSPSVYGSEFKAASMVCAGFMDGGVDTCYGDSGGPLEAPLEGGGYRLVGLTSWGNGCAEPGFPGVYTRVAGSALAPEVVSDVAILESSNGLTPEEILGSGAVPPPTGEPPTPPPPPPLPATARDTSHPFAKCKRARTKVKRKRCMKRVRTQLKAV